MMKLNKVVLCVGLLTQSLYASNGKWNTATADGVFESEILLTPIPQYPTTVVEHSNFENMSADEYYKSSRKRKRAEVVDGFVSDKPYVKKAVPLMALPVESDGPYVKKAVPLMALPVDDQNISLTSNPNENNENNEKVNLKYSQNLSAEEIDLFWKDSCICSQDREFILVILKSESEVNFYTDVSIGQRLVKFTLQDRSFMKKIFAGDAMTYNMMSAFLKLSVDERKKSARKISEKMIADGIYASSKANSLRNHVYTMRKIFGGR